MPVTIVQNNTSRIQGALNRLSKDLQQEIAEDVAETAKALAPIRSGKLRDSLSAVDGKVTTTVDYLDEVEYGTHKTPAQPFITPSVDQVSATTPTIARQIAKLLGL